MRAISKTKQQFEKTVRCLIFLPSSHAYSNQHTWDNHTDPAYNTLPSWPGLTSHQVRSHTQSLMLRIAKMQRAVRHPGVWWPWANCIPGALQPAKSPRSTQSRILSWQSHPLNLLYIGNKKSLLWRKNLFRVLEENEVDSLECQTAFLAKLCSSHGLAFSWELLLPHQAAPPAWSLWSTSDEIWQGWQDSLRYNEQE